MITQLDLLMASWRKSSRSDQPGGCVSVALVGTQLAIRDSKDPDGAVILISRRAMAQLIGAAKAGHYDIEGP